MRTSRATEARQRVARWTTRVAAHVEAKGPGAKLARGVRAIARRSLFRTHEARTVPAPLDEGVASDGIAP